MGNKKVEKDESKDYQNLSPNLEFHTELDFDKDKDLDFDQELENFQKQVEFMLEDYEIEYPSEDEMMMTIDAIRPYVPAKENKWQRVFNSMISISKQSVREAFYMGPLFWILNTLLLIIGLTAVVFIEGNPYSTILLLAPIPTIAGLIEVLKSKNTEMMELELSFKHSLQEVVLSKMMVVGGFNLIINFIFTIVISIVHHDIRLWKLILFWVTPFTVITAISLVVVSRFRNINIVAVGLSIWIAAGGLMSQTQFMERLERVPSAIYLLVSVVSIVLIVKQIIEINKRGVSYEFNY